MKQSLFKRSQRKKKKRKKKKLEFIYLLEGIKRNAAFLFEKWREPNVTQHNYGGFGQRRGFEQSC